MTKNDITKIMNQTFNPKDIAKEKHDAYKKYIISVLSNIVKEIEKENYKRVKDFCFDSPAGDGYGKDNSVIDFGLEGNSMDIVEAINMLTFYKKCSNGEIDVEEKFEKYRDYL